MNDPRWRTGAERLREECARRAEREDQNALAETDETEDAAPDVIDEENE
mgnify:FL=1